MTLDDLFPRVPEPDYEPRVETCPECMARGNQPRTTTTVPGGVQCAYECWTCHDTWTTSWWGGDR